MGRMISMISHINYGNKIHVWNHQPVDDIFNRNFSRFPIGPTVPHRHGHESFVHDAYNVALAWLSYFVPYTITNGEYIHIYAYVILYIWWYIICVYDILYFYICVIYNIYIYIYDMYIWYIIYVWYIYIYDILYMYMIYYVYMILYIYVYESYCTQENQSSLVFQKLPVKW